MMIYDRSKHAADVIF